MLFPLGELPKSEVRAHAMRLGLDCWDKPESQDLCFVPDGDYAGYITGTLGETRGSAPGAFVDERGRRVGTHRGVIHYTVGQRKGLGLALPERWYVLAIDAAANTVTLGPRASLERLGLVTERANWLAPSAPPAGTRVLVRIRYNHAGGMATLTPREDGGVEVRFDEPQIAVTPCTRNRSRSATCSTLRSARVLTEMPALRGAEKRRANSRDSRSRPQPGPSQAWSPKTAISWSPLAARIDSVAAESIGSATAQVAGMAAAFVSASNCPRTSSSRRARCLS